ncbi:DUF4345 family protein [Erythrobacter sp. F6033]|uniref:DUF4345 family protein n=1 Tax=Erythrobacter sp. F6033 TaxID=2926401 RepID=UPI001FF5E0AE|nr:DUF4345 family protein [Erythrobacter sp. F6033]MCK0127521.1 DUF4345 family protein [Erythrobacter sp. F6033]
MISCFRNGASRLYPTIAGCIFLALAIVTFVQPEILHYYDINLDQPSARTAMRAMIGGGEIGIALTLLFGGHIQLSQQQRSLIAAIIFISVGLSRLGGVWIEGLDFLTTQPLREVAIELVLGGAGLWAASNWKASEGRN